MNSARSAPEPSSASAGTPSVPAEPRPDTHAPLSGTGPIVVHADSCPTPAGELARLPAALDARPMVLRPYSHDHRIVCDLVTHLPDGGSISDQVERLLDQPDVAEVHGRNWTGGCYAFTARRSP